MRGRFARRAAAALMLIAPAILAPPAAAQAGKGPAVTMDYLLGRWSDSGDCQRDWVDFRSDGGFTTAAGGNGRWRLEGDTIIFMGQSEIRARIQATDMNRLVLVHGDGSTGNSVRCPAAQRLVMPALPATVDEAVRISRPLDDPAFLIGNWTDDGNCSSVVVFASDGRFTVGGASGRWRLVGERLSFIGDSTQTARARAVGNNRILLIYDNGTMGQSLRC